MKPGPTTLKLRGLRKASSSQTTFPSKRNRRNPKTRVRTEEEEEEEEDDGMGIEMDGGI